MVGVVFEYLSRPGCDTSVRAWSNSLSCLNWVGYKTKQKDQDIIRALVGKGSDKEGDSKSKEDALCTCVKLNLLL